MSTEHIHVDPGGEASSPGGRGVFVSYAREDKEFAKSLSARLREYSFDVWIDTKGIDGGDNWRNRIVGALDSASAVVLILSPVAIQSKWVRRELEYADSIGLKVIPIQYIRCELPPWYTLQFGGIERLEADEDSLSAKTEELVRSISAATDQRAVYVPDRPEPRKKAKSRRMVLWSILIVLGVLAIAGAVVGISKIRAEGAQKYADAKARTARELYSPKVGEPNLEEAHQLIKDALRRAPTHAGAQKLMEEIHGGWSGHLKKAEAAVKTSEQEGALGRLRDAKEKLDEIHSLDNEFAGLAEWRAKVAEALSKPVVLTIQLKDHEVARTDTTIELRDKGGKSFKPPKKSEGKFEVAFNVPMGSYLARAVQGGKSGKQPVELTSLVPKTIPLSLSEILREKFTFLPDAELSGANCVVKEKGGGKTVAELEAGESSELPVGRYDLRLKWNKIEMTKEISIEYQVPAKCEWGAARVTVSVTPEGEHSPLWISYPYDGGRVMQAQVGTFLLPVLDGTTLYRAEAKLAFWPDSSFGDKILTVRKGGKTDVIALKHARVKLVAKADDLPTPTKVSWSYRSGPSESTEWEEIDRDFAAGPVPVPPGQYQARTEMGGRPFVGTATVGRGDDGKEIPVKLALGKGASEKAIDLGDLLKDTAYADYGFASKMEVHAELYRALKLGPRYPGLEDGKSVSAEFHRALEQRLIKEGLTAKGQGLTDRALGKLGLKLAEAELLEGWRCTRPGTEPKNPDWERARKKFAKALAMGSARAQQAIDAANEMKALSVSPIFGPEQGLFKLRDKLSFYRNTKTGREQWNGAMQNRGWDRARAFSEGRAFAYANQLGREYFVLLKTDGRWVSDEERWRQVPWEEAQPFSEGLAAVYRQQAPEDGPHKRWAFVDRDGKPRTKALYARATNFLEGRAAVKLEEGGFWEFINWEGDQDLVKGDFSAPLDKDGNEIPPIFSNGIAEVQDVGGRRFSIDRWGNKVGKK